MRYYFYGDTVEKLTLLSKNIAFLYKVLKMHHILNMFDIQWFKILFIPWCFEKHLCKKIVNINNIFWSWFIVQSNMNRLRNVLKKTKVLLILSGVLVIVLKTLNYNSLTTVIGCFWPIIVFFWWLFDTHLWKTKYINKILKNFTVFYCPSIAGRWTGKLIRDGVSHDFVVEIKQTYTSISCEAYSKHSYSKSLCSELLYDEQNHRYSFVFLWQGKTSVNPDGTHNPTNDFNGTTILIISENCDKLQGSYFTNRSPKQTKGDIILDVRQDKLKNEF